MHCDSIEMLLKYVYLFAEYIFIYIYSRYVVISIYIDIEI